MTSPVVQANSTSLGGWTTVTDGVNVAAGETVSLRLLSTAGVSTWALTLSSCDDGATTQGGSTYTTPTFTAPAAPASVVTFTAPSPSGNGAALRFTSVVNSGYDANGVAQASFTGTFGVYVLATGSVRLVAVDETSETSTLAGWVKSLNAAIRLAGAGGSGVTNVSGTAPIVSSGGTTPAISITAASTSDPGSMSAADKAALDEIVGAGRPFYPTQPVIDSDVIDWWPCDDPSGSTSLANALGGHAAITWASTDIVPGSRRVWAGKDAARANPSLGAPGTAALSASVDADTGCTLEFMTILESSSINSHACTISLDDGTDQNILYAYRNGDRHYYFGGRRAGTFLEKISASDPPNDAPLVVMITIKRTAGDWTVKLYFNGVLVDSKVSTAANITFTRVVFGGVSTVVLNGSNTRVNAVIVSKIARTAAEALARADKLLGL